MFSIEALFVVFVLFAIVVGLAASVRILQEYERAVVFTLGRFERVKGPGLVLLMPFIQAENTYSTMSPLGVGANRSLSVVVCEDEFSSPPAARGRPAVNENGGFLGSLGPGKSYFLSRRTIAKFDDTWNATGLQAQSGPPDEAGSDDDSCGEACRLASLRVGRINAR